MNIGRVEGSVVCSVKTPTLTGVKLLVIRLLANGEPKGLVIASDGTHQAGIGDTVYLIGRMEAAMMTDNEKRPPCDLCVAGIIDPETL